MWFKFIVAIIVVAVGILVGYLCAGKYRARKVYFQAFYAFNDNFITELQYMRREISKLFEGNRADNDFMQMARRALLERSTPDKPSYLTADEYQFALDYFKAVGRTDAKTQSEWFTSRKKQLEKSSVDAENEAKKRGELYLKLGLLAGLALVIIVV